MPEHPPKNLILHQMSLATILVCFSVSGPPLCCATFLESQPAWLFSQDRTRCKVTGKAPAGVGRLLSQCHRVMSRQVCWMSAPSPRFGSCLCHRGEYTWAGEGGAFLTVVVDFEKAMRTIHLISNEGNEGV